jgi:MFS family permease
MASYSSVLSRPGVARVMGTQLLARFAFGMMSLAIVLHVQQIYHNYTIAGIALGAETVGAAISGPLIARRLSAWGPRRVLRIVASTSSIALIFIAFFTASAIWTIIACLIVGLTSPPIQQVARSVYPSLISSKQTSYLFSLDATLQEFLWVFGPVLATMITATYNSASAVVFMACVQIAGTYLFSRNPEIGEMKIPKSKRRLGGILRKPIVLTTVVINLSLVATFGGAEVGTVAVLGIAPSGIVIAALSLGSIIGGFTFGHRAKTKWALLKFVTVVMLGYAAVFFNPTDLVWITICWFVTGLGVAPAFATMASMISVSFGTADSAEAYGWANTGQLLGYAVGAAIAGIVIDNLTPSAAWYVTGIAGALSVLIALFTVRFNPPLDQKDA